MNSLQQHFLVCLVLFDRVPLSKNIRFHLDESKETTLKWTDQTDGFWFGALTSARQSQPPGFPTSIISQQKGHHTSVSACLLRDGVDWSPAML